MCRTPGPLPDLRRLSKKNGRDASDDADGSLVSYASLLGRRPTYREYYAFRLNAKRATYRRAYDVAYGVGIALGTLEPGFDYYLAVTEGEGEARMLEAKHKMARGDNG